MAQQILQGHPIRTMPLQLAASLTVVRTNRQVNGVLHQIPQHALQRSEPIELIEHQPHHALHLLVGIHGQIATRRLHIPQRRVIEDLATLGLVEQTLIHPASQDV
jgi:hypothetical protein